MCDPLLVHDRWTKPVWPVFDMSDLINVLCDRYTELIHGNMSMITIYLTRSYSFMAAPLSISCSVRNTWLPSAGNSEYLHIFLRLRVYFRVCCVLLFFKLKQNLQPPQPCAYLEIGAVSWSHFYATGLVTTGLVQCRFIWFRLLRSLWWPWSRSGVCAKGTLIIFRLNTDYFE